MFRYPFCLEELAVIASGDEDKYNKEVDPRTLPLRPGILIPREQHLVDTNAPSGLDGTPDMTPASPLPGLPYHWLLDSVARD